MLFNGLRSGEKNGSRKKKDIPINTAVRMILYAISFIDIYFIDSGKYYIDNPIGCQLLAYISPD